MAAEEQFEAGGEELRRHFSMDGGFEPEKLRAAPSAEALRRGADPLFTGDSGPGDDFMSTGTFAFTCWLQWINNSFLCLKPHVCWLLVVLIVLCLC